MTNDEDGNENILKLSSSLSATPFLFSVASLPSSPFLFFLVSQSERKKKEKKKRQEKGGIHYIEINMNPSCTVP